MSRKSNRLKARLIDAERYHDALKNTLRERTDRLITAHNRNGELQARVLKLTAEIAELRQQIEGHLLRSRG